MQPFTPFRNVLEGLADELDTEAAEAKRRGDDRLTAALMYDKATKAVEVDKGLERYVHLVTDGSYRRGAQDALANVAARLRSVLAAPLGTVLDLGEVFDDVEEALDGDARTPGQAATVVVEVLSTRTVKGVTP